MGCQPYFVKFVVPMPNGVDSSTDFHFNLWMKFYHALALLLLPLLARAEGDSPQLWMTPPAIESADGTAVVSMTLENGFDQPLSGARALVILTDASGKVVGNQAQWVVGEGSRLRSLPGSEKQEVRVGVRTTGTPTSAQIIFTRLVLKGGTVLNPATSVTIKEPATEATED